MTVFSENDPAYFLPFRTYKIGGSVRCEPSLLAGIRVPCLLLTSLPVARQLRWWSTLSLESGSEKNRDHVEQPTLKLPRSFDSRELRDGFGLCCAATAFDERTILSHVFFSLFTPPPLNVEEFIADSEFMTCPFRRHSTRDAGRLRRAMIFFVV